MPKKQSEKILIRCDDCIERVEKDEKAFCRLRGEKATEYSMQPLTKEHYCGWKSIKKTKI